MTGAGIVLLTTFLASTVEAIEMVTIVVGVGATRGWRSTLLGAAVGFAILAVVVAVVGAALTAIPIAPLRVLVGALLLLFGLQWFRKGIVRVAANGLAGYGLGEPNDQRAPHTGVDWTGFVLSFKGVVLEGLEIALIVVSFGASARQMGAAILAGTAAVVVIGTVGFAINPLVARIPRSLLQLIVGTMLTSVGTFWALEGLGVSWPQGDLDIVVLLAINAIAAMGFIEVEWRAASAALKTVAS